MTKVIRTPDLTKTDPALEAAAARVVSRYGPRYGLEPSDVDDAMEMLGLKPYVSAPRRADR